MSMPVDSTPPRIDSVEELLAHALAMEREAAERYGELADQMETFHNPEVAEFFRTMARHEARHVDEITDLATGMILPELAPWEYKWQTPEAPETPSTGETHYLMTPYHAVRLALRHERLARRFYNRVAEYTPNAEVRALARQFAQEEDEHVRHLERWLERLPVPETGWAEDPDPPTTQE
ncbi:ferritin-like domain-containing protein [Inmirania thermothiophila]|uniref:Rubrerythrin n=1 Tax=Inmirania thermothiophila TaxID=1750597 RepID=A0A3N1Y5C8_9GAMM|nr:ferritin family protein [Inmirania thermothiophila]ROR32487.1 rubrerythrin [Inmirania thermothiophila]